MLVSRIILLYQSLACSSQKIYVGQLFYMQKDFTSVLILGGSMNLRVTSPTIFNGAVLPKIFLGSKFALSCLYIYQVYENIS